MNSNSTIRINGLNYGPENINNLFSDINAGEDPDWLNQIHFFLTKWFGHDDYIEVNTSGSTGDPKIIRISKEAFIQSAKSTITYFGLHKTNTAMLCMPANYIGGKMMLVRAMICGCNLLVNKPSANPFITIADVLDFVAITPYQLAHSLETVKRKKIRKIIVGGSPVTAKLESDIQQLSTEIYETYGMTETVSHIAVRKLNGIDKSNYFQTLPGIEIKLNDKNCLVIEAPKLFNGELITNDIVQLENNHSFKWLGRADHVINSGGIKIFPEQLEKKLEPVISGKFVVGSIPDEKLGEKVIMVIEGLEPSDKELEALKIQLAEILHPYEIPKIIRYLPVFPYTGSDKIKRKEIIDFLR